MFFPRNLKSTVCSAALVACILGANAQSTSFGFKFMPLIPNAIFLSKEIRAVDQGHEFVVSPRFGFGGGMLIRRHFSPLFSIESGINMLFRKYDVGVFTGGSERASSSVSMQSYEVPVLASVNVQLGETIFLVGSFGLLSSFYPSDVGRLDPTLSHLFAKVSWLSPGLMSLVGVEHRLKSGGGIYAGASLNRSLTSAYQAKVTYDDGSSSLPFEVVMNIPGNYLTVDVRYFFPGEQK